jgi:hypothetical protein
MLSETSPKEIVMVRICTCVVAFAGLYAQPLVANELGFPSSAFDADYETVITDHMLQDTPQWPDADDNPPVSARKAIALSAAVVQRLVKTPDDWQLRLDGLTLSQSGNRWYWRAQYEWFPRGGGLSGLPPHFDVIVLMNGKAVEPTLVKKASNISERKQ